MRDPIFFIIWLSLLLSCGARAARASDPGIDAAYFGKTILSIDYAADEPLERSHYDPALRLKVGQPLTRTGVKDAIQGLYDTGSFDEIAVLADAGPDGGVKLTFLVRFSRFFSRFFIEGDDLGGRYPTEVMSLPVGERFTSEGLEAARRTVLDYMHQKGYFQAEVSARTAEVGNNQIDTTFTVQPGELAVVSSIEVLGVPPSEVDSIRDRLGFKEGGLYRRDRLRKRMDDLRQYFVNRGFLGAAPKLTETFHSDGNRVDLELSISEFGQVRVVVDGFKIPKDRLRRLLPALSGQGLERALLEEGASNLKDYLEENGYPESEVEIREERSKSGVRVLRYMIDAGHKVTVKDVLFRGNHLFSNEQLLRMIQIQPARFLRKSVYSVSKLDSDVDSLRNLYRSSGYLDAEVIPLIEPIHRAEQLKITFECREGPRAVTRSVTIRGNRKLDEKVIRGGMRLKAGGPYSPSLLERDRQAILAAYSDAGFLQPKVGYQVDGPDEKDTYAIELDIREGTQTFVNKVIVLGDEQTRRSVIEKQIKVKEDEPLSLGKMLQTQRALYGLGVFDLVRVAPQNPDSAAAYQNVIVRLQETQPFTLRYGLGYQERERVRGILEVSHLNVFGTGQRVDLRVRASAVEQAAVLSFQQPQIRFLPVNSYFSASYQQQQEVSFDSKRTNLSYQYSHPLSDHSWGLLRYRFSNVRVSNLSPDLAREDQPRNLSTVSAIYINDTRDDYADPEKGFFTSTDFSVTSKIIGSNSYVSLFTQNSYFRRLPGGLLTAASFRFGVEQPYGGDTDIPPSERYFAGGASSLRGFETDMAGPLDSQTGDPIGGNALLIGNVELKEPFLGRFQLAFFYDGGNVFRDLGAIRLSNISHTVGIGIRVKTPFGPLRVDYGYNMNLSDSLRSYGYKPGHLFVTIGPPF